MGKSSRCGHHRAGESGDQADPESWRPHVLENPKRSKNENEVGYSLGYEAAINDRRIVVG
jgi:hypothetical protein